MIMKKALRAALLSTALVGIGSAAMAAGTQPGVNITNSIDVTYTSGTTTINRTGESPVSFVVDRMVDFILEGQDASATVTVSQGSAQEQLTFRLLNEGNDTSGYDIDVAASGTIGLTYDSGNTGAAGTYSIYVGPNPGAYDSGTDTPYDPTGTASLGDLAADAELYVKVLASIPGSAVDGQTDTFTVTATALDAGTSTVTVEAAAPDISVVDTFFADTDADGVEQDSEAYLVSAPIMSATKTSRVISENLAGTFDCAAGAIVSGDEAFVPGACVEYTLTVTNGNATAPATSITVTDALPAEVSFVNVFSNTGFDTVTESGGTITATLGSLAANSSAETVIRVTID